MYEKYLSEMRSEYIRKASTARSHMRLHGRAVSNAKNTYEYCSKPQEVGNRTYPAKTPEEIEVMKKRDFETTMSEAERLYKETFNTYEQVIDRCLDTVNQIKQKCEDFWESTSLAESQKPGLAAEYYQWSMMY